MPSETKKKSLDSKEELLVTNPLKFGDTSGNSTSTKPNQTNTTTNPTPKTELTAISKASVPKRVRSLKATMAEVSSSEISNVAETNTTASPIRLETPLHADTLKQNWNNLVEHYRSVDSHMASIMESSPTEILNEHSLKLSLASKMLFNKIEREYDEVLKTIRKQFQNIKLTLKIELNETVEETIDKSKLLFTNEQKLDFLKKKNPDIELLMKELNLDVI